MIRLILILSLLIRPLASDDMQKIMDEQQIQRFVNWYNEEIMKVENLQARVEWNYKTNLTAYNEKLMIEQEMLGIEFKKSVYKNASRFDWKNIKDENLKRQMSVIADAGIIVLPEKKLEKMLWTKTTLLESYFKAQLCSEIIKGEIYDCFDAKGVSDIFSSATEVNELQLIWQRWHATLGSSIKNNFEIYVNLSNEMAIKNNYSDLGAYWRRSYESPSLEEDVKNLWDQVKPLYVQLHAYVRKKLIDSYGTEIIPRRGLIPAHLLGDVLAYTWGGINIKLPFKGTPTTDVTREMKNQNYTVKSILEAAENFFVSLGFPKMPDTFWTNSLFEKPVDGRKVLCHGTAWDFHTKNDYRILICAKVSVQELYILHHEMGHLHYFMQYKDQPATFQRAANPAFHEAIGDVISLSAMTPKHLWLMGLLENLDENYENDINFLFSEALSSVSTLPMNYLVERWRWDIFKGKFNDSQWNKKWWHLRKEIQGTMPPLERNETDFDAGTIFHVATFIPFIRYFLSDIVKYQFHRALCKASGQYDPKNPLKPLFKCDIYNSTKAGQMIREMMKLGSSKHWSYAMKLITQGEQDKIDASALLEYFAPLMKFLQSENKKTHERIGWEDVEHTEHNEHVRKNAGVPLEAEQVFLFFINVFPLIMQFLCSFYLH